MILDALFKRYHRLLICLLLAPAAYFQAKGLSYLTAEMLDQSIAEVPPGMPRARIPVEPGEPLRSAGPILARNPFDSITGALDVDPISIPPAPDPSRDLYDAPSCDAVSVVLIASSDDPDFSFAAIAGPRGKRSLVRQGDELAGHTVERIGWDRVWMAKGGSFCQMVLGTRLKIPPQPKPAKPSRRRAGRGAVPPEIASKIQKLSEREFRVDRSAIALILDNQGDLLRSVRIVPDKSGGQVAGFRVLRIPRGSLLDMLGLKNGDRIRSINGLALTDPQKALEAYARLRSADRFAVDLERGGKNMTIDLQVQ